MEPIAEDLLTKLVPVNVPVEQEWTAGALVDINVTNFRPWTCHAPLDHDAVLALAWSPLAEELQQYAAHMATVMVTGFGSRRVLRPFGQDGSRAFTPKRV